MDNFVIIAILVVVVGAAVFYICRAKKKGRKCIGCPYSGRENCHCKSKRPLDEKK